MNIEEQGLRVNDNANWEGARVVKKGLSEVSLQKRNKQSTVGKVF